MKLVRRHKCLREFKVKKDVREIPNHPLYKNQKGRFDKSAQPGSGSYEKIRSKMILKKGGQNGPR